MKRIGIIRAVWIILLLTSVVFGVVHVSPQRAARQRCVEEGWAEEDLFATHSKWTNWPILRRAEIDFTIRGDRSGRKVHVELRQPVYFLPWQVIEYREVDR